MEIKRTANLPSLKDVPDGGIGPYPLHCFVDKFISEPSDDGTHYIVRAITHTSYEKGEVESPSIFVCECDFKELADIISDLLNDMRLS